MLTGILNKNLIPSHEFISGTADLTGLIDKKFGAYRFGIAIGKKLNDRIIDAIENGPTSEYSDYYDQINNELARIARMIKKDLYRTGIDSVIIEPTIASNTKEYDRHLPTLTADVSHKMVATRAGLGWIGKTGLFISKEFGPRLRLVSLLINQRPGGDFHPVDKSRCGKCNICVDKCPAQAANGLLWDINTHRDAFFNAHKCSDKCEELTKQRLNAEKRICGMCISVCPVGKRTNKKST